MKIVSYAVITIFFMHSLLCAARDDTKSSSPRALRSRMTAPSPEKSIRSEKCYDWAEIWSSSQVLVNVDNNHKLLGRVNAKGTGTLQAGTFVVLEDVKEMWNMTDRYISKIMTDRYISKMALAADSAMLVVNNPAARRNERIMKENFLDDLVGKMVWVQLTSGPHYTGELVSNNCGVLRLFRTEEYIDTEYAGYLGEVLIKWFSTEEGSRSNGGILYIKAADQ